MTVQKWTTVSLLCNGLNHITQSIFSFFTCMLGYPHSAQNANFLIIIIRHSQIFLIIQTVAQKRGMLYKQSMGATHSILAFLMS